MGEILEGAYAEAPSRVNTLLEAAKNEEEENAIWSNLPSGVYDEDIQSDLLNLINIIWGGGIDKITGNIQLPFFSH